MSINSFRSGLVAVFAGAMMFSFALDFNLS